MAPIRQLAQDDKYLPPARAPADLMLCTCVKTIEYRAEKDSHMPVEKTSQHREHNKQQSGQHMATAKMATAALTKAQAMAERRSNVNYTAKDHKS